MLITILDSGESISTSDLISATFRSDCVPVPVTLELTVRNTEELKKALVEKAVLLVTDDYIPVIIVKVQHIETQTIKDDERIGGIACTCVLTGCDALLQPINKAIALKDTTVSDAYRACGAKTLFGENIPLPEFICLRGRIPALKIAEYLQQEAAIIYHNNGRLHASRIDQLLQQEAIEKYDPSALQWINNPLTTEFSLPSLITINNDGTTIEGELSDSKPVGYIPRLDNRRLRNMEKVLITQATMVRPLNMDMQASNVVTVNNQKFLFLTTAHRFDTGALGGATAQATKVWLANLGSKFNAG